MTTYSCDAQSASSLVQHQGRGERVPPPRAPDALVSGIRWGLLFSLVGFWLPVVLLASRGLERA